MLENKFNLTLEQNIFLAKKKIVDYIWKSANLEGIAVTFPQTDHIFNGYAVANMPVKDIIAINNLKRAWYFLLDSIDYPIDFKYICQINGIVGGDNLINMSGQLRNFGVQISGTNYIPPIPNREDIVNEIQKINNIPSATDRALTLMLYLMRTQAFADGNKRTSMLAANHIMIQNGAGVISIPIEKQLGFKELLVKFYETNDMTEIKKYTHDIGIDGINFIKTDELNLENNICNFKTIDSQISKKQENDLDEDFVR